MTATYRNVSNYEQIIKDFAAIEIGRVTLGTNVLTADEWRALAREPLGGKGKYEQGVTTIDKKTGEKSTVYSVAQTTAIQSEGLRGFYWEKLSATERKALLRNAA